MPALRAAAFTRIAVALVALLHAPCAWACTLCHSPVAREVRRTIGDESFLTTAGAVLAPVPLLLLAIYLASRES